MATSVVDEIGGRDPHRVAAVSDGDSDCVPDGAADGVGRSRPDPAALPSEVLEAVICQGAANLTAAETEWLLAVAEFDRRRAWEGWRVPSCAHWLAWQVGLDLRAAREKVRVAAALTVFGRIRAEMAMGHLSYTKVRAITRVATERNEATLVDIALAGNTAQVERLVAAMRRVPNDGDDPHSAEDAVDRRAWDRRTMTYASDEQQRMMTITVRLPYLEGAELVSAIEGFAEAADPMDPTDTARDPHAARRADAAVAMGRLAHAARSAGIVEVDPDEGRPVGDVPVDDVPIDDATLDDLRVEGLASSASFGPSRTAGRSDMSSSSSPPSPAGRRTVGSGRPLVSVSVDLDTILDVPGCHHDRDGGHGRDERDEHAHHRGTAEDDRERDLNWASLGAGVTEVDAPGLREPLPISRQTALRMLCDCDVEAIVTRDGTPVGISERSAIVRGRQRRLVLRRDEHRCRWPGCHRRGRLQIHHIQHRARKGGNAMHNLLTLCPYHHRQVHEGGWSIRTDADALVEFVGPSGQVVRTVEPEHDGRAEPVHDQGRSSADGRCRWEGDRLDLGAAVELILWHDTPHGIVAHERRRAAGSPGSVGGAVSDSPGSVVAPDRGAMPRSGDSPGSAGGAVSDPSGSVVAPDRGAMPRSGDSPGSAGGAESDPSGSVVAPDRGATPRSDDSPGSAGTVGADSSGSVVDPDRERPDKGSPGHDRGHGLRAGRWWPPAR